MEDIDIEKLDFDKYNRDIYLDAPPFQGRKKHIFDNSDPQKKFKIETNKVISKSKKDEKHDFGDIPKTPERKKKRKI